MIKVTIGNQTYEFLSSDFKYQFPVLYKLYCIEESPDETHEINFDENPHSIITPWTFKKYVDLLDLIRGHLTPIPEHKNLVFLKRFDPDTDTTELSFDLPEFHASLDGDRFVVGLDSSFGKFFFDLENDKTGPDGEKKKRGLNLGSLTRTIEFIGWFLPLNLCGARLAQHTHRQNSSRTGYTNSKMSAILVPKKKSEKTEPVVTTKKSEKTEPVVTTKKRPRVYKKTRRIKRKKNN